MRQFTFAVCSAFAVLGLLVGASQASAQGADVRVGTWKQNFMKSTGTGPAPQSSTRTYEAFEGDGVKFTQVAIAANGTRTTNTYAGHLDGKVLVWTGSTTQDAIAMKRNSANSFDFTLSKAGKAQSTGRNLVSSDGKTMYVVNLSSSTGQILNVGVYEKQ